ncbi:MAG: transposase [Planctomycetes bacterium]|nr:transposase [Planctomycetota bacterium]
MALARYVFRVAISNARILDMDEDHVTYRYKDNDSGRWETERLPGVEFLRRFLMHVLPKGFHKVRYYGLWNPAKRNLQAMARLLLELSQPMPTSEKVVLVADLAEELLAQDDSEVHGQAVRCPTCGSMNVVLLEKLGRGGGMVT